MAEPVRVESYEALDALVCERVFNDPMPGEPPDGDWALRSLYVLNLKPELSPGGAWVGIVVYEEGDIPRWAPKAFSRHLPFAWEVVERMRAEGWTVVIVHGPSATLVRFASDERPLGGVASGVRGQVPLLCCEAALRAKGVEVELALPEEKL